MRIRKSVIPSGSLAEKYLPVDYSDVFTCETGSNNEIPLDEIMVCFWTDLPRWVVMLLKLRNFAVRFVGLKSPDTGDFERHIREGSEYGFASFPAKNENESVMLLKDSHLDAYISIHIRERQELKEISAVTLVNFHNRLGRVYFAFIRPFHGLVVRSMLKRAVNKAAGK